MDAGCAVAGLAHNFCTLGCVCVSHVLLSGMIMTRLARYNQRTDQVYPRRTIEAPV